MAKGKEIGQLGKKFQMKYSQKLLENQISETFLAH